MRPIRTREWLGATLLLVGAARGGDDKEEAGALRVEILYTINARVDSNDVLDRIVGLVHNAYPTARFADICVADLRAYYDAYRGRLLAEAGLTIDVLRERVSEESKQRQERGGSERSEQWLEQRAYRYGYEVVKEQVKREVALQKIYEFLLTQARVDGLREVFGALRTNDNRNDPVCATESGAAVVVFRDLGGTPLTAMELADLTDGDVKFGDLFVAQVVALARATPRGGCATGTLGDAGDGRQVFRLLEAASDAK